MFAERGACNFENFNSFYQMERQNAVGLLRYFVVSTKPDDVIHFMSSFSKIEQNTQ